MASCDGFTPTGGSAAERAWMDTVEDRLEQMETQQRLFNSSVRGGAIAVYTDDLDQVGRLGVGTYSSASGSRTAPVFSVLDPNAFFHQLIDMEDGWVYPRWQYNWVQDTFVAVTSASYVNTWKCSINILGLAIYTQLLVGGDSGTTGTIQLNLGGNTSGEYTISAGTLQVYTFIWDVSDFVNLNSQHELRIKAKRDTGTNNINVYAPDRTYSSSLRSWGSSATSDGLIP